jgi:hypothetical protein
MADSSGSPLSALGVGVCKRVRSVFCIQSVRAHLLIGDGGRSVLYPTGTSRHSLTH